MKKRIKKSIAAMTASTMLLSGCVYDGAVSPVREAGYDANIGEREGLALARIVSSPMNILGHSYGEYHRWCEEYPVRAIGVPFVSIPSGCLAACADIVTGAAELLTFQQFKKVSYPWESFDKDKSKPWGTAVVVTYAVAAIALVAFAEAAEEADPPPPPPPPHGKRHHAPPPPPPQY